MTEAEDTTLNKWVIKKEGFDNVTYASDYENAVRIAKREANPNTPVGIYKLVTEVRVDLSFSLIDRKGRMQ